jgi:hypothetical protein
MGQALRVKPCERFFHGVAVFDTEDREFHKRYLRIFELV